MSSVHCKRINKEEMLVFVVFDENKFEIMMTEKIFNLDLISDRM